jgi:hypothetical protein
MNVGVIELDRTCGNSNIGTTRYNTSRVTRLGEFSPTG